MKQRILITGGSGLIGQYLNIAVEKENEVLSLYNSNIGNCNNFNSKKLDITDFKLFEEIFSSFKPDIVIHSAAVTNPIPLPEQNPKDVYNINVNATAKIAELSKQHRSKLVYISTDLVYAGYRGSMLPETSKLIPVSLYAETKLMGETKIQSTFDNYLILRTALIYGIGLNHSVCHFQKMIDSLKRNKPVRLFIDQFRTPISLKEVSEIIAKLSTLDIKNEIINLGGKERVSRYELGEILCSIAGFDKSLLEKINLDDLPDLPKVEDVSLNTDKLQSFGIKQRTIKENINEIIRDH